MAWILASVILILVVLVPGTLMAQTDAPTVPSPAEDWTKALDALPGGGWQFISWIGKDQHGIVFASTHHVTRVGATVTLWFRWEYRLDQSNSYMAKYRSDVTQEQFDCLRQASRVLSISYYLENNLSGGSPVSYDYDEKSARWSPAIPGTLGEDLANWVCGKYKPAPVVH